MKLARRKVPALAARASVSAVHIHAAGAEAARRLADYADALRYEGIDAAAVEQA
jgi:hypothetical protein